MEILDSKLTIANTSTTNSALYFLRTLLLCTTPHSEVIGVAAERYKLIRH